MEEVHLKFGYVLAEGRDMVRTLLASGADPTAQDELHCRIALQIAAMVNNAELMKIIMEDGVDANVTNVQNTTPLLVALNKGANLCIGLLLSAGADCNLQDDDRDNAFHIAADATKIIRENLNWIVVMLRTQSPVVHVRNHRIQVPKRNGVENQRQAITNDLRRNILDVVKQNQKAWQLIKEHEFWRYLIVRV